MSGPESKPRGLARCLNAPGGINVSQACARAALHLEALSEKSASTMRQGIDNVAELAALGPPSQPVRREMHELSCSLAALGGTFGRDALSKAAYSFCRLLDETEPGWSPEAVGVHINAMRLLFTPARIPSENQAKIIEGLVKVRRSIGTPSS